VENAMRSVRVKKMMSAMEGMSSSDFLFMDVVAPDGQIGSEVELQLSSHHGSI
jgi:hypothetical protein